MVQRKTPVGLYFCPQLHKEGVSPECPRHVGAKGADLIVWDKVCAAILEEDRLMLLAREQVEELGDKASSLYEERQRIQKKLEETLCERERVITWARQGKFTATDMENQLRGLTSIEISLKRELAMVGQSINIQALENWEQKVEEYWADLRAGIEEIKNAAPQTEEEQHRIFLLKKRIVNSLVSNVTIDKERNLKVTIRLNLFDLSDTDPDGSDSKTAVQVSKGEIYTHIPEMHRTGMIVVTV